jgi:phosphoenolpyruvate carboxylase
LDDEGSDNDGSLAELRAELEALWAACLERARTDPFTNPYLLFGLEASRRLDEGTLGLSGLDALVGALAAEGFVSRAERLCAYLGAPGADRDAQALRAVFERLADQGFDAYAAGLARPPFGVVTTAHPTFALNEDASERLVELATGQRPSGEPLDDAGRQAIAAWAKSAALGPPAGLTLDLEHAWSVRALANVRDALEAARAVALDIGRARWPDRWTALQPNLLTLATWVGFDQDGRTDVTWRVSVGKRLDLKAAALRRLSIRAHDVAPELAQRLDQALSVVQAQMAALEAAAEGGAETAAFARAMVEGRAASLADPTDLLDGLMGELNAAADDRTRAALMLLRAEIHTHGVCLADIHVRLNAAQLHNAVRRDVGLETSPADPANRRAYFAAINRLIGDSRPVDVGFQTLLEEPTSAKRLFITLAQMKKFIDARSRVRFLIAETESGFTLLAALYFARLFGVEDVVEISPLYETEEAMTRGEAVIEEALKSPYFRDYLKRQGRLCVEFGFSDSGRFIGQMAATFRIERLRLRIAELMEREGLAELEVVLFNTHGESIGRGGHPTSLQDRLSYCAPPQNRRAFARRGIAVREEDSFQGGDGYLPFFTPPAARATLRGLLQFAYAAPDEAPDPIYDRADFASDFFASIQQSFVALAKDPDYPALLSLFGTRILNRTGSRPDQRQSETRTQVRTFKSVSELRAIPNNAILQGLGDLTNTTFGVASAAEKDPPTFAEMATHSARFGQALEMASVAASVGDLAAMRAYAATVNPSLWLDRRAGASVAETPLLASLTDLAERAALTSPLSRTLRRIRSDPDFPLPIPQSPRRDRLRFLHALRIAVIQRIALLAARVPVFTPYENVTREDVQLQLMRLDVAAAVETLRARFPAHQSMEEDHADFGEQPTYQPSLASGYAKERAELFEPLLALHALILRMTTALDLEIGACG